LFAREGESADEGLEAIEDAEEESESVRSSQRWRRNRMNAFGGRFT
jgi:hypothetical protein